jgi:hypothetical protein
MADSDYILRVQAEGKAKSLQFKFDTDATRAVFDNIAKVEFGAHFDTIDDLWALSGIQPTSAPDEDSIREVIRGMSERKPRFFDASLALNPLTGKPGNDSVNDQVIIEDGDPRWNDATWQMTNREAIHASTAAKQARAARRGY